METKDPTYLKVDGMTCSTCAMSIDKKLEKMGLKNVRADYTTGEVSFVNDAGVDEDEIEKAVDSLGFRVVERDDDEEEKGLADIEKKFLFALIFTLPLFLHMFMPNDWWINHPLVQLGLALPVYGLGFWHFGKSAWNGLKAGVANMDVLIFMGSTAAFGYSLAGTILFFNSPLVHDYMFFETAATIITLVLLGNVLEHRSVNQTTSAIKELTALKRTQAKKVTVDHDGKESYETIEAEEVKKGDQLAVNSGDKIPVDGKLIKGECRVDESMITGESDPVKKKEGDDLIGGTIIHDGSIRMKAEKVGDETVLSNIIDMVKHAQDDKPNIQRLGDKVSSIFVPTVIGISLLTFLLSYFLFEIGLQLAIMNSVAVLVISCPCAMGLATPTAVVAGIGRAAKNGILIKGGHTLEEYSHIRNVVFDKTGTLTTGKFKIKNIHVENGMPEDGIKNLILSLEQHSSHPIARAMVDQLQGSELVPLEEIHEEKGQGMTGKDKEGNIYTLGSGNYVDVEDTSSQQTIFLKKNDTLLAKLEIEDEIRKGAKELIYTLQKAGIRTIMLSGDKKEKCEAIAAQLGIDSVYSEQKPDEKLKKIEELSRKEPTAMVGDGINDAPALARSNVGVSLGNATEIAIQSAQVILLDGSDLQKVARSLAYSKATVKTIKQNLFWAFFYNVIAIPLAALGFLNPMIAALAMAGSDVVVIGNSIRLKYRRIN